MVFNAKTTKGLLSANIDYITLNKLNLHSQFFLMDTRFCIVIKNEYICNTLLLHSNFDQNSHVSDNNLFVQWPT